MIPSLTLSNTVNLKILLKIAICNNLMRD